MYIFVLRLIRISKHEMYIGSDLTNRIKLISIIFQKPKMYFKMLETEYTI